jgi:hypothetical protein
MTNLTKLKTAIDLASVDFDNACRPYYCDGRWGAYRAYEYGEQIPVTVDRALNAYHAALKAYYLARDGAGGFFGKYPAVN